MTAIQYKLDPAELAQLKLILRQCPSFDTLDFQVRQDVLQNCYVDCFFEHKPGVYQLGQKFFVNALCANLLRQQIDDKPALAHFLEYMLYHEIPPADHDFVIQIITTLEQQHSRPPTEVEEVTTIRQQLAEARRQAAGSAHQPPRPAKSTGKIEKNALLKFDLEAVLGRFIATVKYWGIYSFTISGDDRDILENYIIARLVWELGRKTGRPCHPPCHLWLWDVTAPADDQTAVEHYFLAQENIPLADLFQEKTEEDIVLVVWSQDIPEALLTPQVTSFSSRLTEIATPYFHRRCLMIIWVNLGLNKAPLKHEALIDLPKLETFEVNDLKIWFETELKQAGIAPATVRDRYLERVILHQGRLVPTYTTLQQIIRTINGHSSQGATA